MNIIYVRPARDSHCSCNCCYARNYDSSFSTLGERVDVLYDVQIGGMVPVLCKGCLTKLHNAIGDIVGADVRFSSEDVDCYCE